MLAEDGSFVGHFVSIDIIVVTYHFSHIKQKDTVAVPEKCSVVDSEVLSALKDDVESSSRVKTHSPSTIRLDLSEV